MQGMMSPSLRCMQLDTSHRISTSFRVHQSSAKCHVSSLPTTGPKAACFHESLDHPGFHCACILVPQQVYACLMLQALHAASHNAAHYKRSRASHILIDMVACDIPGHFRLGRAPRQKAV